MAGLWAKLQRTVARATLPPRDPATIDAESAAMWERLFRDARFIEQAPRQVLDTHQRVRRGLEDLHAHSGRMRQDHERLLLRIIQVVDICDGLTDSADVAAVRDELLRVLDTAGIAAVRPEVGRPPPGGCEGRLKSQDLANAPDLVIDRVIQAGYVRRDGIVVRPPSVLLDVRPAPPAPTLGDGGPEPAADGRRRGSSAATPSMADATANPDDAQRPEGGREHARDTRAPADDVEEAAAGPRNRGN